MGEYAAGPLGTARGMTATQIVLAGRYRLQEPIGQGGMGRVWLATDELLGREVAAKELVAPAGFTEAEVREMGTRAMREARAAARLSHANVVAVYDVVVEGGSPWIVMEYVRSQSLFELVARQGPLDVPTVARIGLGVLAALRAAHGSGVVHRDVKPGNVLIAPDGRVVLSDFGLATIVGDPAVTRAGMLIGSPSYMAPERARDGDAGPAADLWSLGATLYFAVEGHAPYERTSALATITALATEDPPPAGRAGALAPVLHGLLQRLPEARLDPVVAERLLRQALVPQPSGVARVAAAPATSPPRTRIVGPVTIAGRRPGRRRLGVLALIVLALVAGLTAWSIAADTTSDPIGAPSTVDTSTVEPTAAAAQATGPAPEASTEPPVAGGGQPVLPAGWYRYTDETGFSVAIPQGWSVQRSGTIVYFREPVGGRYLGIDQTDQPQLDPVADWAGKEAYRVGRGDFPDYRRIRLEEV
jgi:eukaryotic-like serine/threonine-protein kinase